MFQRKMIGKKYLGMCIYIYVDRLSGFEIFRIIFVIKGGKSFVSTFNKDHKEIIKNSCIKED